MSWPNPNIVCWPARSYGHCLAGDLDFRIRCLADERKTVSPRAQLAGSRNIPTGESVRHSPGKDSCRVRRCWPPGALGVSFVPESAGGCCGCTFETRVSAPERQGGGPARMQGLGPSYKIDSDRCSIFCGHCLSLRGQSLPSRPIDGCTIHSRRRMGIGLVFSALGLKSRRSVRDIGRLKTSRGLS